MSDIVERMKARLPRFSGVQEEAYDEAIRDVARYVAALDEARAEITAITAERDNAVRTAQEMAREVVALTAQVAALTAEVAELLDMNSGRNEIEQERDECRNSMRFYAAETKRLTARGEAMEAALTNIRPVVVTIWKGGAFARGDGVLQIIEWIDAALRTGERHGG